jgi:carbonic anhydrase/acetyltransferase-like protein (isoleucine patch superfamily)
MLYRLGDIAPRLAKSSWIAPTAALIGDVSVGDQASVWFGTVVRADTEAITIGARTNVQDLAMLHADPGYPLVLEEDVTVGHHVVLHGCRIGAGSLIGIGAVVLNGAVVGKSCLVAARSVLTEGKQYPDGSLVMGTPARVVGPVTEAHRDLLEFSAAHYTHMGRRFAKDLGKF